MHQAGVLHAISPISLKLGQFKVLLKRKFKVAFFYLKYFFIPRRSLITKNNATLRPRSRRDRRLKCDTKEGQNLKTESAN